MTKLDKATVIIRDHPDAFIVQRTDHLRFHGDVHAIAVEVDFDDEDSDFDTVRLIECELDGDELAVVEGEPRSIDLFATGWAALAEYVREQRKFR